MEYREINIENFGKICRTCLSEESLMPLPTTALEDGTEDGLSIVDVLSNFIPIMDLANEEFPQQICLVCIDRLNQFCDFIKNCNKNERLFKSYLGLGSCVIDHEYSKLHSTEEIKDEVDDNVSNNRYPPFEPPSDDDLPQVNKVVRSFGPKRQKVDAPLHKHKKKQTICEKKLKKRAVKSANVQGNEHKPHTCLICNKLFQKKYQLTNHTRVHTKEKPYKCGKCELAFSLKSNLRRHSKTHTGEKNHICEICGKGFIQYTSLKIHIAKHHNIKGGAQLELLCKICSRVFVRMVPYRVHMKKYHPNELEALNEESRQVKAGSQQQAQHKCETCGRYFAKLVFLRKHEARHGEKKFLCSECGKGFVGKSDLQSHLKVHTGEKPHKCPVCNKSFGHAGSLNTHILTHSGYRPFDCDLCDKSFTQISHLKVHQRTHSGDRPYSCSFCGKTFALNSNLTVHTRIHTGETPYMCTTCGRGFHDSSSMKKHKNSHLILHLAEDNFKEESI